MANPHTSDHSAGRDSSQADSTPTITSTASSNVATDVLPSTSTEPATTTITNNIRPTSVSSSLFPPQNDIFLQAPSPNLRPAGSGGDSTEDLALLNPLSPSAPGNSNYSIHITSPQPDEDTSFPAGLLSNRSQDFDNLTIEQLTDPNYLDHQSLHNEPSLRRRRPPTFHLMDHATTGSFTSGLAPRTHSIGSRSSTSSAREPTGFSNRPTSPTISSVGSKRSSFVANNRSSLIGTIAAESSGGWMSGLSEVMANVSSRVVGVRAQELTSNRSSFHSGDHSDGDHSEHRPNQHSSVDQDASSHAVVPTSPEVPPWVSPSGHSPSEHDSAPGVKRSGSKRSSGSQAGGSNHAGGSIRAGGSKLGAAATQRQGSSAVSGGGGVGGRRGLFHGTDRSKSGAGSNLGKSASALPEKVPQDDEESVFAPGGFKQRGSDKMKLEGRSFKLFSPENPLRLFLASILMSKYTDPIILVIILTEWVFFVITPTTHAAKNVFGSYWTHYGLLAINTVYTLEIISKAIVYGLFFDRNGFQWRKRFPDWKWVQRIINAIPSNKTYPSSAHHPHPLSRVNSVRSRESTFEKSGGQFPGDMTTPMLGDMGNEQPGAAVVEEENAPPAHAPFFRSYYNRLDGIVVMSYWIDFAFMMVGIQDVYIFKAISALRPLRLLTLTEGTSSYWALGIPASPEMLCGGYYLNGTVMGIINYIGQGDGDDSSPRASGLICQQGQVCMQFPDYNPGFGLISFDNIFLSLLTIFTISSMEGWTDVEYWVMDGDSRWAALFFCVSIFLMSFLMIPLFIAGITYSFGAVRAEKRHSAFSSKPRNVRILLDTDDGWQFDDQINTNLSPIRQKIVQIVNHPWFPVFGAFMVFLNLVAMCFRRFDSTHQELQRLQYVEMAYTAFFFVEIIVRIIGHSSWKLFWKKKANRFDLFLALTTVIIQIPTIQHWEWYRYLTVFQVLRAYRLIPAIPGVRELMRAVIGSATGMLNLLLITFMFLLVCAPVPMMLFGGDMPEDIKEADPQPVNFDDLGQSFISLFIILSGENWINIMYESLESHPEVYKEIYGAIFFVVYYCASHYVLLNLFIAIVLEHFELDDDEKYKKQLEMYFEKHQRSKKAKNRGLFQYFNPYSYLPARPQTLSVHGLTDDQTVAVRKNIFREFLEGDSAPNTTEIMESKLGFIVWLERMRDYWFPTQAQIEAARLAKEVVAARKEKPDSNQTHGAGISGFGKTQDEIDANLERLDEGLEKITWDTDRLLAPQSTETLSPEGYRRAKERENALKDDHYVETREFLEAHPMYDRALFILPTNNRFRQWCRRLVGPRTGRKIVMMNWFNWAIFVTILVSIGVIIVDDPIDRLTAKMTGDRTRLDILDDIDYGTTIIFIVEQALRILADGFLFTPTGYLRDLWNVLDLAIVLMSCIKVFGQIDHLFSLTRAVRALSCLRVIRLVRYFEGVSAMFAAIGKALPRMVVAMLLTFLLFWPFAIYGVNIYAGYFYKCNDTTILFKSECVGEFMELPSGDDNAEILVPRIWANPYDYSFDTIQAAILVLFEMASQEGWIMVLQSGRAVPNHLGDQPFIQPNEPNRFNSFYFLLFMLIGSIVFVQIFIGVILETFKTWNGISLLTVEQRRWIDLRRQLRLIKPTAIPARPQNKFRALCYDMVNKKKGLLWRIMTVVLVANVCLIASQHYAQPQLLTDVQDICYFIFLGVYSLEIMVKLCGYGFNKWRLSRWNLYDMIITVLAVITLVPRFIRHELWTLRLEKFLLITISFRLAQRIDSLQVLFRALAIAFGSIINITAVFMVVFTVYAIMFREIFGMTRLGRSTTGLANFETFGNTMLMLIRMTTGENWDFVMHDMMVEAPSCTPNNNSYLESDCGSRGWAYFMFLSFYIVCTYILLNMFIAVIISNFSFAYQHDTITTLITREDLRNFKLTWAKFDPRGTGYIDPKYLSQFLRSLDGRLCTRVYPNLEFSIPSLVKAYGTSGATGGGLGSGPAGASGQRLSSATDRPNGGAPSSPQLLSTQPRGGGSNNRLNRMSASPGLSATNSYHGSGAGGTGTSPRAVPITISSSEVGGTDEKRSGELQADLDFYHLQQTLSKIDVFDAHRRRHTYNLIYKEAMATCGERGVSFYSILDILSFTLVDVEQALGMEEFLKRNERVKEIKAAVARETIYNLLMTIVARRNFLKLRRSKQNSRLRPEVPRIVIDTSIGNDRGYRQDTSPMLTTSPYYGSGGAGGGRSPKLPSPMLDFSKGHSYHSDDDSPSPSPGGAFSSQAMLSISSNDSVGWDLNERDAFNRMSGQSDSSDYTSDPRLSSPQAGYAVEGSIWFNMLQDQIREQEDALFENQRRDSSRT
ncbi:calcium channel protein [Linnemannia exigua]|uniref:Calcium-channel protein CCH1 n=1 Tax=Linnemannia exigua TaxID=604196 RepID=A0AAD4H4A3_9FUNG|nr:calcium channel protein [Linnemannia exigua]